MGHPERWEKVAAAIFGISFLGLLLILTFKLPNPTPWQMLVLRVALALAAGGIGAVLPGFITVNVRPFIRAGGALALFVVIYAFNPQSFLTGTTKYTIRLATPNSADRDRLQSLCKQKKLMFEMQPANEQPITATVASDQFGLELTFDLPARLVGTAVPLSASGEALVFSENPIKLTGTWKTVSLTAKTQTAPASGALLDRLPGRYQTYFGSSARWWGVPGKCTSEGWDGTEGHPIVLQDVQTVITRAEGNSLNLRRDNVGDAQLPKLTYVLRLVETQNNELTYEGGFAPNGWVSWCANQNTNITVPASASGRVKFVLSNDDVLLKGTLLFSADYPQCAPNSCPTTYRDVYTFDHRRFSVTR